MLRSFALLALAAGAALTAPAVAGEMVVTAVDPAAHAGSAPVAGAITVHFDRPVNPLTVSASSFWAFGRWSGPAEGVFEFSNGNQTVTLRPDEPFSAGEMVTVYLSVSLRGTDSTPLRAGGFSFQFMTRARQATRSYDVVDTLTTNFSKLESSRPYGGVGADLDNDGWLDIATVNEDTADVRVMMNKSDGTGFYHPVSNPGFDVMPLASPSETGDFNRDGNIDMAVADSVSNMVSILLGNGDGTFLPQQTLPVAGSARGIAVLDADGDGDQDVANTNTNGAGTVTVYYNNGLGLFSSPHTFDGGVTQEWSLGAADMDEDGILDLVVGGRNGSQLVVHTGDGDGTFTQVGTPQSAGGTTWMIAIGDVNGDGHDDVASANSTQNVGAILFGDGSGNLGAPQTYATDSFPLATDLGDLDGDGDLDWTMSSFNGDWTVYENIGLGQFVFDQEINAPSNASCTILLDIDNDRDLDMALIDEIADVVMLAKNNGTLDLADINLDGVVDVNDLVNVITAWGPCPVTGPCAADVNGDGQVSVDDLVAVIVDWTV